MRVHSIFYTVQGEGFHLGRPSVFVRFSGCNLWTGREEDRGKSCSAWCDTDFVGGTRMSVEDIAARVEDFGSSASLVVLTGGEPGLQVTDELVRALRRGGREVAIETNGTVPLPSSLDWVCVSPKGMSLEVKAGDEMKVVYPQEGIALEQLRRETEFSRYSLQPLDNDEILENIGVCVEYVKSHPGWLLGIQAHKQWSVE